ncbi:MAG: polysaccharide biosynthesis protein [Tannerella sp.]|jgi:FlaA1/EpsC-like NDP-sugar epimerase|nr:polysaccharide biosynthesis protein [Tannerella sp.]
MRKINPYIKKLFRVLSECKVLNHHLIMLIDLFIVMIACIGSYYLTEVFFKKYTVQLPALSEIIFVSLTVSLAIFLLFRINRGIIRYSTVPDLWRVLMALILVHTFVFTLVYFSSSTSLQGILFAYLFIQFAITFICLISFRSILIITYQFIVSIISKDKIPAFIFDTDPRSVSLAQSLEYDYQSDYKILGFLTHDSDYKDKRIANFPIYYANGNTESLLKQFDVKELIFTNEKTLHEAKELVDISMQQKIKVMLLPSVTDPDKLNRIEIKQIQIEDLLNRDVIHINTDAIREQVNGKVIMVTGAAGSIGSEIVRQLAGFNPSLVVCVDNAETPLHFLDLELKEKYRRFKYIPIIGDVRNKKKMETVFIKYQPDFIFHAAAYKHVPMMENNPCEAVLTNVMGTKHIIDLACKYNVGNFVMISTDKAVNPTNIMGATKRIAEIYLQSYANHLQCSNKDIKFVTTRFGNVLGSNGSVIPRFKQQITEGGPVTVTHPEINRYFMTIREACMLVLETTVIGESGFIYMFDMGKPVKIADLAKRMIKLAGLTLGKDIEIKYTGLRPGEKLYEELLGQEETTQPTIHKKIMVAKVQQYDFNKVVPAINHLVRRALNMDIESSVLTMKQMVPEYVSENSEFKRFDHQLAI